MAIEVNGTSYESWADVPADVRGVLGEFLADSNHDGVPDLLEGKGVADLLGAAKKPDGTPVTSFRTTTTTRIQVGDQTYTSLDQVPPHLREALQRAGLFNGAAGAAFGAASGGAPTPPPPMIPDSMGQTPAPTAQPGPGQVMLNGVPVDVVPTSSTPKKKHWWKKG